MNVDLERVRTELLSTGKLRASINYGNPVLAQRGADGEAQGVSAALARELAARFDVPLEVVPFDGAGAAVEAAAQGQWDIGFLAVDPMRTDRVSFTTPYVVIEGTYLVRDDGRYSSIEQLDAPGARIAVGKGAAYDLYLTRTLQNAEIVRSATSEAAIQRFLEDDSIDAAAGVRQPLEAAARNHPGLAVLPGRFTAIHQAMATPVKNTEALRYLNEFIREMIQSGFVARALRESGQGDATVASIE